MEKRKSSRTKCQMSVTISGRQGQKEIQDFALYGVFIRTENSSQFNSGDEIYLTMKLPDQDKQLQVIARVVHVSEKGIGAEFMDLPAEHATSMEYCYNIIKHGLRPADT